MSDYERAKALPPAGIGNLSPKKISTMALAFVTVIACATSASAQWAPNTADSISASATLSSAQSAKAQSADAKKKQKLAPKPDPNPSAAAMSASPTTSVDAAGQVQNPLTPLYSIRLGNDTNPGVGPLRGTHNLLLADATSASAQSVPNKADPDPSAAAVAASPTTSFEAALQAQNPLTPLYSLLNENSTNFGMGPLHRTQDVLLVEPVIPVRLTPDFNLVTRWITPVIWQPALAPSIGPEFGLGNIAPQFFFTPAHQGNGFVWALGANAWLPTASDKTLGVNHFGGGPTAVALKIQGPLLYGVLAGNTWAGSHGSSATLQRINQMSLQPFVFYNLPVGGGGWYVASLPLITADWTVPNHKWTLPIGGGIGRVIPVGGMLMNARVDAYYDGALGRASGITNVGSWTAKFTLHFVFPGAKVPSLF